MLQDMRTKIRKIVFLCHGNICRSPMAEYVMKHIAAQSGMGGELQITSAAVSDEESGNPIYPPAQRKLREKGIPFGQHSAHRISRQEFDRNDLVIVMDRSNLRWLSSIVPGCMESGKVHLLMEYAGKDSDVADPWYTGDFETTFRDVLAGCEGLLKTLI